MVGDIQFIGKDNTSIAIEEWKVYNLQYGEDYLSNLNFVEPSSNVKSPGIWKGQFEINEVGDVFMDVSTWGKGVAWVNGKELGRFWNIGPTQTMYIPGPWLKKGSNEVIVLDLLGPSDPVIQGLGDTILNEIHS